MDKAIGINKKHVMSNVPNPQNKKASPELVRNIIIPITIREESIPFFSFETIIIILIKRAATLARPLLFFLYI